MRLRVAAFATEHAPMGWLRFVLVPRWDEDDQGGGRQAGEAEHVRASIALRERRVRLR